MEIFVSHVRRKQIPSYVLPHGYKRRPLKQVNHTEKASGGDGCEAGSPERRFRRKRDSKEDLKPEKAEKQACISPDGQKSLSPPQVCSSGSSNRSRLTRAGSSETVASCVENNGTIAGVNEHESLQADDVQSTVSGALLEKDCLKESGKFQNGLMELEPNVALGVVLKGPGGVGAEPVQKPVIRLSLTSTA